jgi:hypothetical protein
MLILTLGLNFFGLSSNYRQYQTDEYFLLTKVLNISYQDFYFHIPTFTRRYLVNKIIQENENS